ncbi:MAG: fructosamine kinase family protein [Burkholderiales bacterium]|nr:fructosamine kinase family protein [Burkholderiales bacterium]
MFRAEAEGLAALRAAAVAVPRVRFAGERGGEALIEMERLDLGARADWPALAGMLARLHRHTAARYGWENDNWIGLAPQLNGWRADWPDFWFERRLAPQAARARAAGFDFDTDALRGLLDGHRPPASLLHGDLWHGNVGFTPAGPVLFDPAVYYGDREADLAMSELFGGFPPAFYAAYRAAWPLESGYAQRRDLYNLYHVLNHLNLFGAGYLPQAQTLFARLRALARA